MQRIAVLLTLVLLTSTALASSKTPTGGAEKKSGAVALRPWSLQDSIAVNYVAPVPSVAYIRLRMLPVEVAPTIVASPDGEYFFFVNTWGELESDSDVTSLKVYRTRSVLDALTRSTAPPLSPYRSVTMRARHFGLGMSALAWTADSGAVVFEGYPDTGWASQAFRLNVHSGALEQLTNFPSPAHRVRWVVAQGEGVLYAEEYRAPRTAPRYPAEWVPRKPDGSFVSGIALEGNSLITLSFAFRGQRQTVPFDLGGSLFSNFIWFSPDGSQAIGITAEGRPEEPTVRRFVQFDLAHARVNILAGVAGGDWGPYPGSTLLRPMQAVFWSEDGRRVIFVNAVTRESESGGASQQSIIEYDVTSGRWRTLESLVDTSGSPLRRVKAVGWLKPGRELLVTHDEDGQQSEGTLYSFTTSGVKSRSVPASVILPQPQTALARGLKVRLEQGANVPPRVIAWKGRREIALTARDATLQGVHLQRTEPFSWREPDGKTVTGGLTLPPGFRKGNAVPLVIYPYLYTPEMFLPDGQSRSTDAAQALAARGMAALQIDSPDATESSKEGPLITARLDAAVGELVRQGIVDPARVGFAGFSHVGYQALYVTTHPGRTHLAAAMGADFFTGTYAEYLMHAGTDPVVATVGFEQITKGSFWENKAEWLKDEPSFNADRIVTPFLLSAHNVALEDEAPVRRERDFVLGVIGAFVSNEKPIEYQYLGYSSHLLTRPLVRLASMEAMVDWMAFWLQDKEDNTTLNDQLCSQPNVLAAKGADLSAHTDSSGQPTPDAYDSANSKPLSLLPATGEGAESSRRMRESNGEVPIGKAPRPWYWLDCTPEGISKARANREAMYARWRPMREQQERSVEAAEKRPKTHFVEIDDSTGQPVTH